VLGMQSGIFAFETASESLTKIAALDRPGHRFNDATVDDLGRLWVSTIAMDLEKGAAAIHRVCDDLTLQTVVHGLSIPNGMAVDVDRRQLYYSDSHWDIQTIWTMEEQAGAGNFGPPVFFASTLNMPGRTARRWMPMDATGWPPSMGLPSMSMHRIAQVRRVSFSTKSAFRSRRLRSRRSMARREN
jgi:hypothetical protein